MTTPELSVIITSFNTKETILKCLDHLYRSRGVEFETIIVDNNSTDGSVKAIKEKFPDVKFIINDRNTGFGYANNQGMKIARGDFFLLLNSDCFVEPATVKTTITALKAMRDSQAVGCKLLNTDGSIQFTWGYFPTLLRIFLLMTFVDNLPGIRKFSQSIHVRDEGRYQSVQTVDWLMGAYVMIKREVFEKTGGFDEKFFMYGEEMEWMYRMKRLGYKIRFVPQTYAVHLGGASSPDKAPAILGEIEGWKYWFAKYEPLWKQSLLPRIINFGCLLRMIAKPKMAKYYKRVLTGN